MSSNSQFPKALWSLPGFQPGAHVRLQGVRNLNGALKPRMILPWDQLCLTWNSKNGVWFHLLSILGEWSCSVWPISFSAGWTLLMLVLHITKNERTVCWMKGLKLQSVLPSSISHRSWMRAHVHMTVQQIGRWRFFLWRYIQICIRIGDILTPWGN